MLGGIPPPPANGNWHRYLDQESGREYFHNAVTGQTTWERPAEMPAFPPVVVVVATRAGLAGAHRPFVEWGDLSCCWMFPVYSLRTVAGEIVFPDPNQWAADFCCCCCNSEPGVWVKYPTACLCPCLLLGANATMMAEEPYLRGCGNCCTHGCCGGCCDECGCHLGWTGFSLCCSVCCISLVPFGILCCLGSFCVERRFILARHEMQGWESPGNWCLGCCWPCSTMQHFTFLRKFNRQNRLKPMEDDPETRPLMMADQVPEDQP
eukprot:TRINITY_DN4094_c0_g1_i3.p1 TRINITY_DN4094_c0_g1~~TRINITY_DN4094_c0_g1_i3.p1  ORF type:complete len:264 (-),score=24.94 TRINITY_DN4094_c0_g1_i3:139-930(-)